MSRSHRVGGALLGGIALLATAAPALATPTADPAPVEVAADAVDGRVLVTWQPDASAPERREVRRAHGLVTQDVVAGLGLEALALPAGAPADVVARVGAEPAVAVAEPDYLLEPAEVVDDPGFDHLWGLHNTGQTGGRADVDIDAPEAWRRTTGSPDVVVAVIDTGMDLRHPDLADNIWTNPGEVAGNGVDDDGNGHVDDVHGWDFLDDDPHVRESPTEDAHGTHVAGTIAAVAGNGIGVAGVAPDVTIMPLRFLGAEEGSGSTLDAVRAVDYAATHGARVINASWGADEGGETLKRAIARATDAAFVAAVGNESVDVDTTRHYPAEWARDSHGIDNVLTVAAVDAGGALASFSNYGDQVVDVAGPGTAIVSTLPDGRYGTQSGTSMAAPHAAGVAALAASIDPDLDGAALAEAVKAGAQSLGALDGTTTTGGLVNAAATLDHLRGNAPAPGPMRTGSASGDAAAGETISTDTAGTGATPDVPVQTAVTVPVGGTVDIDLGETTTTAPDDWTHLGVQVTIDAPAGTATDPLVVRFHLDGSLDAAKIVAFRNGAPVAECPAADVADPDPCVTERTTDGDDVVLTVLSSRGGRWNFGHATVACPEGRVPATGFTDLGGGVHDPAIACMGWWGVANGMTTEHFAPTGPVTRAQMASFVARAVRQAGGTLPTGTDSFVDDDGSVHEADIDALAAAGIVRGVGADRYAPRREVTRAEMAAFLVRADTHLLGDELVGTEDAFRDDDGLFLEDAIDAAFAGGLVRGTGGDTYAPSRSVLRAEMATFLSRLLDRAVALGDARTPV